MIPLRPSFVAALFAVAVLAVLPAARAFCDEAESDRTAIVARWNAIQSLQGSYQTRNTTTFANIDRPQGAPPLPQSPVSSVGPQVDFSFLRGMVRLDKVESDEGIHKAQMRHVVPILTETEVFRGSEFEQLCVRSDAPLGSVGSRPRGRRQWTIALGLGLEADEEGTLWDEKTLREVRVESQRDGKLIIHRVESRGQSVEFEFDPRQAYALVAYRRRVTPQSPVVHDVTADDFRLVDHVLLPFRIVERSLNANGAEVTRWEADLTSYALNSPGNSDSHYFIRWKRGMVIPDERTKQRFHIMEDDLVLTDDILAGAINAGPDVTLKGVRLAYTPAGGRIEPPPPPGRRNRFATFSLVGGAAVVAILLGGLAWRRKVRTEVASSNAAPKSM